MAERNLKISSGRVAVLFLAPAILATAIFKWYPFILGFKIAFEKYSIITTRYVGLENFRQLFNDPSLLVAFRNTLYYSALSLSLFLLPVIVAILLMEMKPRITKLMMVLWFIPLSSMATLMIWKWIYNVQFGLFNGILTFVGLPTLKWLNDPKLAMICLVLPSLIMYGPGLVFVASVQSIPQSLYDAAEIEGTGLWKKIWLITLPRLRPVVSMMLLLSVVGSMQMFDSAYVMTGGGPGHATRTIVMQIVNLGFEEMKFGYGTALALLLFLFLIVLVSLQRHFFKENIDE